MHLICILYVTKSYFEKQYEWETIYQQSEAKSHNGGERVQPLSFKEVYLWGEYAWWL